MESFVIQSSDLSCSRDTTVCYTSVSQLLKRHREVVIQFTLLTVVILTSGYGVK
jgi:hypothetical protein